MLILGWHGGWASRAWQASPDAPERFGVFGHDASAVILRNGRLLAGIEEERLDRVKHSGVFPRRAIRFCLEAAGASIADVDFIAIDSSREYLDSWVLKNTALDSSTSPAGGVEWLASLFEDEFGVNIRPKLKFCKHHLAHLYAAWYSSGFEQALGVCLDAEGDGPSGLVAHCSGEKISILRSIPTSHSLGYYYLKCISILGYKLFDEYKVMGLAPYGDPRVYMDVFRRLYSLHPEGRYAIVGDEARERILVESGLTTQMRRKGEAFNEVHKNIAAAIQLSLEEVCRHVIAHFQRVTQATNLCFTGGVAQNCAMTGKILSSGLFEQLYVPPCAHDGGNALGAALSVLHESGQSIPTKVMEHVFIGPSIGTDASIGERLRDWGALLDSVQVEQITAAAAGLIASGEVIAWVQGRSEFGPRSLGNRSILADPRPAENKHIINSMVKKREGYRPFAPSVLEERAREFFELPETQRAAPFMTLVVSVKEPVRELLGAITHVDGTARIQTVSREHNPLYHSVIEKLGILTGTPIVLNTSFNNNAEPIVDSVDDAIICFLTTGIQRLIIGEWLISKRMHAANNPAFLELIPSLPASRKLVVTQSDTMDLSYSSHSLVHHYFAEDVVRLSDSTFRILRAGGGDSVRTRCADEGITGQPLADLTSELYDLWERRIIEMAPPRFVNQS